ncbi:MAG: hypothetical protein HXX20_02070 [Chloroflexi bacterium]|nr:hypothetical protein [Chloroflexota bacterium]
MTQIVQNPSFSDSLPNLNSTFLANLPASLRDKLSATLSQEEMRQLNMSVETIVSTETKIEETPAQIYERLEKKYAHLHGVEISSVQVEERYGINRDSVRSWVRSRWVRTLKTGMGHGVQTAFDEGDVAVMVELNSIRRGDSPKPGPYKGGWRPPERW